MEKDCCFTNENNWFRYRAAGIVVEGNEALFVSDDTIDHLYTVGGGVHMGESAEACVKREIFFFKRKNQRNHRGYIYLSYRYRSGPEEKTG